MKKIYKQTLTISAKSAESALDMMPNADPVEICKKYKSYETVETFTVKFKDGREMDIKICCGDCNDTESNPLWAEAVLFDRGCEIARTEAEDRLYPEWKIETEEAIYLVKIKKERVKAEIKTETIKIKYFDPEMEKIRNVDGKSDWYDLRASEDVELKIGDHKLIPLGVAMALPAGYEAYLVPRSSTFENFGILQTNSVGIIDNSYCGDNDMWRMPVYATRDIVIHKGDRICQFRLNKNQPEIKFIECEHLDIS